MIPEENKSGINNSDAKDTQSNNTDNTIDANTEMLNKAKDLLWSNINQRNKDILWNMANSNEWNDKGLIIKYIDLSYTFH